MDSNSSIDYHSNSSPKHSCYTRWGVIPRVDCKLRLMVCDHFPAVTIAKWVFQHDQLNKEEKAKVSFMGDSVWYLGAS